MPVYNQVEYTRTCLESLFRHTDRPFDLVVVDNGSKDGTSGFLHGLRPSSRYLLRYGVLSNDCNLGVAIAWNQGIRAAEAGGPVCLLNNDVVLTSGWLSALLGYLAEFPHVGIVGPHVTDGPLPHDYNRWAQHYVAENRNREDEGFHGCCFVLSRQVIDRVGLFDERFEIAVWEDVDYHMRARQAGFSPRVTHRAVVHHFGSKTISAVVGELRNRNLYMENLRRFTEKWGINLGNFTVSRSTLIQW